MWCVRHVCAVCVCSMCVQYVCAVCVCEGRREECEGGVLGGEICTCVHENQQSHLPKKSITTQCTEHVDVCTIQYVCTMYVSSAHPPIYTLQFLYRAVKDVVRAHLF